MYQMTEDKRRATIEKTNVRHNSKEGKKSFEEVFKCIEREQQRLKAIRKPDPKIYRRPIAI